MLEERDEWMHRVKKLVLSSDDHDEALVLLERILEDNKGDIDALSFKGMILDMKASLLNRGSPDGSRTEEVTQLYLRARRCYEAVLDFAPLNNVAYTDLGDSYHATGDFEKALEHYDKAIALLKDGHYYLSPEDEFEGAFWSKADLLREMGRESEARQCRAEGRRYCPNSELLKEWDEGAQGRSEEEG